MRPFRALMFCMVFLAAAATAHAEDNGVYVVTYVDVMPNAASSGATLLKQYGDASRKEDGSIRVDVLQEIARPNRFAIVEVWKDKPARDAHVNAASTTQFRARLKAIANAPYDERITSGLYVGPPQGQRAKGRAKGAIYVVTHVDVIPAGKDDCMALLKDMSTDTPKDAGNLRYDVLQQPNRPNHFAVVETWSNRKALDAHAMDAHTRAFREKLAPLAGALYDERFYRELS
jgi:autoinducer 2-degrading protein